MHTNRSPAPDEICVEMLKATLNEILPFLNLLLNDILDSGIYPSNWFESIFVLYTNMGLKRRQKTIAEYH